MYKIIIGSQKKVREETKKIEKEIEKINMELKNEPFNPKIRKRKKKETKNLARHYNTLSTLNFLK